MSYFAGASAADFDETSNPSSNASSSMEQLRRQATEVTAQTNVDNEKATDYHLKVNEQEYHDKKCS